MSARAGIVRPRRRVVAAARNQRRGVARPASAVCRRVPTRVRIHAPVAASVSRALAGRSGGSGANPTPVPVAAEVSHRPTAATAATVVVAPVGNRRHVATASRPVRVARAHRPAVAEATHRARHVAVPRTASAEPNALTASGTTVTVVPDAVSA